MRVCVITDDAYLMRKVELELSAIATVGCDAKSCDFLIYDCDGRKEMPEFSGKIIKLSRSGAEDAEALPIARGRLEELIKSDTAASISLYESDKSVMFKGRKIKLTSHEYSLLSLLLSRDGYTSRETIAKEVWGEATDGLINIYIHYLREKLEADGDKVIISSRKYGYKINEKYLEVSIC